MVDARKNCNEVCPILTLNKKGYSAEVRKRCRFESYPDYSWLQSNLTLLEGMRMVEHRGIGCITRIGKMQNTRRKVGACIIF